MKSFKIHLIRHGLTQGNLDGVYVGGGLDVPLCAQGEAELHTMMRGCEYPKVGMVFSSPMQRAVQSAEILFPDVAEKVILETLRENIFGEFEGKKAADLMADPRFAQWLDPKSGFVPKGGESGQVFAARTAQALGAMFRHMMDKGIREAACVTRGGVIMSMLSQKAVPPKPAAEWMAQNGMGFSVQADAAMLMRDDMVEVVGMIPNNCGV